MWIPLVVVPVSVARSGVAALGRALFFLLFMYLHLCLFFYPRPKTVYADQSSIPQLKSGESVLMYVLVNRGL